MMSTPTSLPPIPEEVVVEFVMPYAFDCLRDALHLMLVCRRAHRAATTNHSFWEPFLWRRFHQEVFHRLKLAYHKKYVMWPTSIENDSRYGGGGLMAVVRSKFFVAQQVPDLWGHLNPISCSRCDMIIAAPWWRCIDCSVESKDYIICVKHGCRDDAEHSDSEQGEMDDESNAEEESNSDVNGVEMIGDIPEADEENSREVLAGLQLELPSEERATPDQREEPEATSSVEETKEETDEDATNLKEQVDDEEEEEAKCSHKPEHKLQLVVENTECSGCKQRVHKSWWCCSSCLRKRTLFIVCDLCKLNRDSNDPFIPEASCSDHELEHWTEGVQFVDRWSIEAPHPPLSFNQAWNEDRKKGEYTGLYLLKLYAPRFTNYGCYACFLEDRPSLTEGWLVDGAIRYGIKYTGWGTDNHVFEGQFEKTEEGFPDGPGTKEWRCGLIFKGDVHTHRLAGQYARLLYVHFTIDYEPDVVAIQCSLEMVDGSSFEGSLRERYLTFGMIGKGFLTLPDGRSVNCRIETSHGRRCDRIHFLTKPDTSGEQDIERFIVSTKRGILEPVDEFEETDYDRDDSESEDEPQPDPETTLFEEGEERIKY